MIISLLLRITYVDSRILFEVYTYDSSSLVFIPSYLTFALFILQVNDNLSSESKTPKGTSASGSGPSKKKTSSAPLLNSHFAAEEEVIQKAQAILRNRLSALESKPPEGSTSGSRKHARRRLRQKIYLLTSSSSENHVDSEASTSVPSFAPASAGQAPRCFVQSGEA